MTRRGMRTGAALITALIVTGVVSILLGALLAYVSFTTRTTSLYLGNDVCRLAAQSEIELAKAAVYRGFLNSSKMKGAKVVVGAALSNSVFDWFGSYAGCDVVRSIGSDPVVRFDDAVTTMGCTVRVGIARVERLDDAPSALVTFVAEARRVNPGGVESVVTIAETVRFAQERSRVFDNAYFVNNYGWFQGSGSTANGDVRANGDIYLDSSCKINGNVYAAQNEELGVDGDVTNYGKMDSYSSYKSASYGSSNAARPLRDDPTTGSVNPGGYDAPRADTTTAAKNRIHANEEFGVEMPYIGDISSDESAYLRWIHELQSEDSSMCKLKHGGGTIDKIYKGVGPSGLETVALNGTTVTTVRAPDYGSVVLIGTDANPIELNGPIIIPGDVIIKGKVKGQGTIYAGRNIHIIGNIEYVNPPSWSGKSSANAADNATADLLGLMAKGNIVLGDCTEKTWLSSIDDYLSKEPYVQKYACDTSDAMIGYPATFGGDYTATELVGASDFAKCQAGGLADFVPGGYDTASGQFGKLVPETTTETMYDWRGRPNGTKEVPTGNYLASFDRKYYQTVCDDALISDNATTITRIDAVLYNNHGIFGKIGRCSINGSLVCRNEGIQYSERFYLNWDSRLYSRASDRLDNDKAGLPKSNDHAPQTVMWMEVPGGATFAAAETDETK